MLHLFALALALPLVPRVSSLPFQANVRGLAQALFEGPAVVTQTHTATAVIAEFVTTTTTLAPCPTPASSEDSSVLFLPPSPSAAPSLTSSGADDPALAPDDPSLPLAAARRPLVMAYYPDWVADTFPPERIDFARFDWIDFAFAVPNANFGLGWDGSDTAPDLLRRLVTAAHRLGKKVKLSVGGWTGSKYFSQAVANDQNRHTFVTNIVALYNQFGIDGIDIDWEYPGQPGNTGNVVSPADTANYFSFLTLLRASLPPAAKITAAVQTVPFADANGNPLTDASQFASVLDWVLLMNYDVWGSSSAPGPNAPLSNACHNSTQPTASADAAVRAWTAAGFPRSKLVLGVPSYGYVQRSGATRLRQRQAPDDSDAQAPSDDSTRAVTVLSDEGTADSGQVQFRDLVRQGALCAVAGAPGAYAGCGGFTRVWDACSSTPFLRSPAAGQVVTYDDAQSLGAKAQFVRANGVLGVNMFDVHGDTDRWDLVDALRKGLGLM